MTPFSPRALDRALTAIIVADARHLPGGANTNKSAQSFDRHGPIASNLLAGIVDRAVEILGDASVGPVVEAEIRRRFDEWASEQTLRSPYLNYQKRGASSVPLLHKPETGPWGRWTCPNSLRETEPSVNLIVDDRDSLFGFAPAFQPPPTTPSDTDTAEPEAADIEDTDSEAVLAGIEDDN